MYCELCILIDMYKEQLKKYLLYIPCLDFGLVVVLQNKVFQLIICDNNLLLQQKNGF